MQSIVAEDLVGRGPASSLDGTAADKAHHLSLPWQAVQAAWALRPTRERLEVIRRAREWMAVRPDLFAAAVPETLARTTADTLAAEFLPLLAAFRFLEREGTRVLHTRRLGRSGRPLWLAGVTAEIERVPLGRVLIIGPSNYPLFLPGVQAIQALAAGNAVIWKPGQGGAPAAHAVANALVEAGLPEGLLVVAGESAAAGEEAIRLGVDKIVLTGSAHSGRAVLRLAAETLTPVVAELSGADAVIVLPSANLDAVVEALAFGLRLNGSATCMAPRRVLLVDASPSWRRAFVRKLRAALPALAPVPITPERRETLRALLEEAIEEGASPLLDQPAIHNEHVLPTVLLQVRPEMRLAQTDIFAPVLMILDVHGTEGVLAAQRACPFALTAAIFGNLRVARGLASRLDVGTVLINDLIVPTADPRLPFGGRGQSGFGSTRGAEGLLEMTAPRVIAVQHGRGRRRFQPTGWAHLGLFAGTATLLYARSLRERRQGLSRLTRAAKELSATGR